MVSAVGHEIDTTILDYVADLRAPTPSAAAELCVPDQAEMRQKIFILEQNIQKNIQSCREICYNRLQNLSAQQVLHSQQQAMQGRRKQLDGLTADVQRAAYDRRQAAKTSLQHAAALAASLNPYGVLARGYAIPMGEDGAPRTVEQLSPGDAFLLQGAGASALCTVNAVNREKQHESTEIL